MTDPVAPPLLDSADLSLFQGIDQTWFLNAAGEVIRAFCDWHISPSITVTDSVPIQPDGTIMLRSRYVTGVSFVAIDGVEIDPSTYELETVGYIKRTCAAQVPDQWPVWPMGSDRPFREYPSPLKKRASVTYTHGYPTLPPVVASVGYELASRAMELPSGAATGITAGPQTISFGALGLVLTDEDRRRLARYKVIGF